MSELIVTLQRPDEIDIFLKADAFLIGSDETAVRITGSFSLEEMEKTIAVAHERKKKIYLNFSKIFIEEELENLANTFLKIAKLNFDGIFFSDFSIYQLAKQYQCLDKLIYASETQIVNYKDITTLEKRSINHFIVSKEMTYEDIILTASKVNSSIGMLIFGHYGMFYSKRKLIANYVKEFNISEIEFSNKANLHIVEKTRKGVMPIMQNMNGTNIFSPDIMCGIEEIPLLLQAGVKYFIFDTAFLNIQQASIVFQYFDQVLHGQNKYTLQDIKNETNILELSTGFLYKKIGLK